MVDNKRFLKQWFADRQVMDQVQVARARRLLGLPGGGQKKSASLKVNCFALRLNYNIAKAKAKEAEPKGAFSGGWAFASKLKAKGFKRMGSGAYSTVLAHPSSNKVIKILNNPLDDGWVPYVKWADDNGYAGKFAPKVFSYKFVKKGGFGLAVMEKLDNTIAGASGDVRYVHAIAERLAYANDNESSELGKLLLDLADPGAAKFIEDFKSEFKGKGRFDLHQGNWMVRGDKLVLTDPLCGYMWGIGESHEKRFKAA